MTIPKKSSRSIDINSAKYRYKVTGNDMIIDVIIEKENCHGQKLKSTFEYHNELPSGSSKEQDRKITPATIKSLVLHALNNGWEPDVKGKQDIYINGEEIVSI